jgi:hypothetical protein
VKKKISTGKEDVHLQNGLTIERAHPQLVHWWLLVHSSLIGRGGAFQ